MTNVAVSVDANNLITNAIVVSDEVPAGFQRVSVPAYIGKTIAQCEADHKSQQVREFRNELLSDTDWTQVSDAPVDTTAWATYRQALRDIPSQSGFPDNVTWPQEP